MFQIIVNVSFLNQSNRLTLGQCLNLSCSDGDLDYNFCIRISSFGILFRYLVKSVISKYLTMVKIANVDLFMDI